VENWDRRAEQWERAYREGLSGANPNYNGGEVELSQHAAVMTRHSLDPPEASIKSCEIHFEQFSMTGLAVLPCEQAALYGSGRTTGMVVCAGHSTTSVAAFFEGYLLGQRREAMGASDVYRMLQELNPGITMDASDRGVTELPDGNCVTWPADREWKPEWAPSSMLIDVPATVQRCPALEGLQGAFKDMALRVAGPMCHEVAALVDRTVRNDLRPVILSGGATLFPGYEIAMRSALSLHNQESQLVTYRGSLDRNLDIIAPPEREISDWIGASCYGDINHLKPLYKDEWEELGPAAVHRNLPSGRAGYRKAEFNTDLHEINFGWCDSELEGRAIPSEITPLAMQATTFSKHHYSFDPLWSQQVLQPNEPKEVRFDAERCAALFTQAVGPDLTLSRAVGSWADLPQAATALPPELAQDLERVKSINIEEEGEELTVLMRWGATLEATFGRQEELIVYSTQDVWASILNIVRPVVKEASERLEVSFGGEAIRTRSGTYAEYAIEDGARLTATLAPPKFPPLLALSTCGAGTAELLPENEPLNGKAWQVVMMGINLNQSANAYDHAADIISGRNS